MTIGKGQLRPAILSFEAIWNERRREQKGFDRQFFDVMRELESYKKLIKKGKTDSDDKIH